MWGGLGLEGLLSACAPEVSFEYGLIAALVAAVFCVMIQNRLGLSFLWAILGSKGLWSMMVVIVAIFVFKDVMYAAHVVDAMSKSAGGEATLIVTAAVLPFLVAMVSGITIAFVGATFPLMLGVLNSLGMHDQIMAYSVLALFSGFAGVMVSPIHICFLLTCQFFKVDIGTAWRKVVVPGLLFLAFGVFWFWMLR